MLARPLIYDHVTFKTGDDCYDATTGSTHKIETQRRRLYDFDSEGRMVCQKGWLSRINKMLQSQGFATTVIDKNPPKDPRVYAADWDRVFDRFTFRPTQDICLAQIDMHDGGIIDAVTAFGKMWVLAMICNLYPRARIDIVVPGKEIAQSLRRLLTRTIADVGLVGVGKRHKGARVTIYSVDSLQHSDFDADIVLVDEVHASMTDVRAEKLSRYWFARMYGFTASADTRFDNAHRRMEGIFGPTIFHMPYPEAEALGLVVPIIVQWLDVYMDSNPIQYMNGFVPRKKFGIWRNDSRNQVIAQAAQAMVDAGHQTLILCDTIDHVLHLRKYLPTFEVCYAEGGIKDDKEDEWVAEGLLRRDERMTSERRDALRRGFEQREFLGAIANSVWAVGVSFDSLQVLVRADGGASETNNIQWPGRVCRIDEASGKGVGVVIDLNDHWDSSFQDRSEDRRRAYGRQGWTQYMHNGQLWTPHSRSRRVTL